MSRRQEIDNEIVRLIGRFTPQTHADFEVPNLVYAKIAEDNAARKSPYRVSYDHIRKIMYEMRAATQQAR